MNAASLRDLWRSLEPKGQLTLVGSGLLVVATIALLFMFASRPSYTVLASNLDPADTADVTKALESAGISYELRSGGTEIAVEEGQAASARVALAKGGLPRGGHVGFELFDGKSLGASSFQQQVNYQRALEGEIARTVEGIAGIDAAQVQLVLPEESLFADEGTKATAAVLLDSGAPLDAATVRGVAHLVASSVKGLNAQDVTITDDRGALLWPDSEAAAGGTGATARLRAEQAYAAQLSAGINAMLVSTLGPGKAQARVRAELDLDTKTIDSVTYARRGTPLETRTDEETLASKGGGAAPAPAGTASNVPSYTGAAGATSSESSYRHETSTTTYGVDKTVERTVVAPGAVKRLDVALLVDESVPKNQAAALQASVASLAGIDRRRGDTLAVSTVKFAAAEKEAPKASPTASLLANPIGLVKWVGLAFTVLVFLFLVRRTLKRRETEPAVPEPTWLREIQRAVPLAELEAAANGHGNGHGNGGAAHGRLRDQVEAIAREHPKQVAGQVGTWLKD